MAAATNLDRQPRNAQTASSPTHYLPHHLLSYIHCSALKYTEIQRNTLHCNSLLVLCDLCRRLMRLAVDGLVWRDWKMESRRPAFNWIELKNWRLGYFRILSHSARRGGVIIKKRDTQWDHIELLQVHLVSFSVLSFFSLWLLWTIHHWKNSLTFC